MNRGAFQSLHWSLDNMRPLTHPLLSSSSFSFSSSSSTTTTSSSSSSSSTSSSSSIPQFFSQPSNNNRELMMSPNWLDNQALPESWSQLLMGGLVEEEDRCSFTPFQTKKTDNWEDQMIYPLPSMPLDVKKELSDRGYIYHQSSEELIKVPRSFPWSQITMPSSSPMSCIATSLNRNMLDFSANGKKEMRHNQLDHSFQKCNSTTTGSPYKKARVQVSSTPSTFKVRKEKLGDRITALHQLVSPFGKTDTASVLLEAIGYIRFLQSQIQALSSPYLAAGSDNNIIKQQQQPMAQGERSYIFAEDPGQPLNDDGTKRRGPTDQDGIVDQEPKKDLKSRGLCLVPVSFTLHVCNDNGADYWAPTFGGGF